jgi:hypothetical protein
VLVIRIQHALKVSDVALQPLVSQHRELPLKSPLHGIDPSSSVAAGKPKAALHRTNRRDVAPGVGIHDDLARRIDLFDAG